MIYTGAPRLAITPFRLFSILDSDSSELDAQEVFMRASMRLQATAPFTQSIHDLQVIRLQTRVWSYLRAANGLKPTDLVVTGQYLHPHLPIVTVGRSEITQFTDRLAPKESEVPDARMERARALFPQELSIGDLAPLTVDLRSIDDVDLTLLVMLAQLLTKRRRHVYLPSTTGMMEELGRRCIAIVSLPIDRTFSPQGQALKVISAWVGKMLGVDHLVGDEDEQEFWKDPIRPATFLLRVVETCIRLQVDTVENLFRKGALHCLLDQPEEALTTFRAAMLADNGLGYFEGIANQSIAHVEMIHSSLDPLQYARIAAYLARAIGLGSAEGVSRDLSTNSLLKFEFEYRPSPGLVIIQRLLREQSPSFDPFPKRDSQ